MKIIGAWRSLVARAVWDREVAGSNPVAPTRKNMARKLQSLILKAVKGLAYSSTLLQWFFLSIIYLSIASKQPWFNDLITPSSPRPVRPVDIIPVSIPTPMVWLVGAVVVLILLVAVVYTFRRLPGSIVHGGDKLTEKPADLLAPILLKLERRHPTKNRRLILTRRLIWLTKILVVTLPVVLLVPVGLFGWPMNSSAAWAVTGFLTVMSIFWFVVERILAKTLKT